VRVTLEVASEASVAADPGQGPLDDPALGQDDEAAEVAALHDLELPSAGRRRSIRCLFSPIGAVGEDALNEREQPTRLAQQGDRAIAVLDVGGMDEDAQQEAERVDQDMALAARRFLPRVVARRVERGPPFTAPRAVWLSMIATVGLASRPWRSRSWT